MVARLKLVLSVALTASLAFAGVLVAAAAPAASQSTAAAHDDLVCPDCAKLDHTAITTVVGNCQSCGKFTGHKSIHYCDKCAKDKQICRYCGKSLTAKNGTGIVVPAPKTHMIEYKKPFIKSLNIHLGDSIVVFAKHKGDPGLFDPPASFPYARTTDSKPEDVLSSQKGVKRLDKDTIQAGRFQALRAGEAAIIFWDFGGGEYARIKVTVTVTQAQAAVEGLKVLKELAHDDPQRDGFASLADLNSSVLGDPITHHYVSIKDLRAWKAGNDAGKMIQGGTSISYPVLAGGKICHEIQISKRKGSWRAGMWSSGVVIKKADAVRALRMKATGLKKKDFILVKSMNNCFLAYKLNSQWYFVNLFSSSHFKIDQVLTAEKVFDALKPAAIRYNGLPM